MRAGRAVEPAGHLVLDLGEQPACDYFPRRDDPGPDPVYPLQMWLCSSCGLAQLLADPTVPEEPRGTEPAALVAQAADAVERVAAAGLLPDRGVVAEYGSPHGGSWLGLLTARGLVPSEPGGQADVILDCFGMMHAADQRAALAERAARMAPGGVLLLQYHALSTIIRCGQWNALRHGHYAYYSTTALTAMLAAVGFSPRTAWRFEPLRRHRAAGRDQGRRRTGGGPDDVRPVAAGRGRAHRRLRSRRLRGPAAGRAAHAKALHDWLAARTIRRDAGSSATAPRPGRSRCCARREWIAALLPAVIDASPAKQGLRMPGTDIPVAGPAQLAADRPDAVLLFVPDLLAEVRDAYPGGRDRRRPVGGCSRHLGS